MSPYLRERMFPSSDSGEEKARVPLFPRVRVSGPFGAQRGRDHVHGSGRPAALTGPCRDHLQASSHQPKPWGPGASVPEFYWESRQQSPWWLCCLYLFPASLPLASQTWENTISEQNPEDVPTWWRKKDRSVFWYTCNAGEALLCGFARVVLQYIVQDCGFQIYMSPLRCSFPFFSFSFFFLEQSHKSPSKIWLDYVLRNHSLRMVGSWWYLKLAGVRVKK